MLWLALPPGGLSNVGGGWSRGEISFQFSGQPAGNSLETMLMKFTFPKSHFEIVYNQKETLGLWPLVQRNYPMTEVSQIWVQCTRIYRVVKILSSRNVSLVKSMLWHDLFFPGGLVVGGEGGRYF